MECDRDPDFHLDNITVEKMTTYIRDFKNMLEGAGGFHNPQQLLQAIAGEPFEAVCLKLKRAGSRAKDDVRTLAISRIGDEWGDILASFQENLNPGFLRSVIFWFTAQKQPNREMPRSIHERVDIWNVNSSYDLMTPGEENFTDFEKDLLAEALKDARKRCYWMTTNSIFFRYKTECLDQLLVERNDTVRVLNGDDEVVCLLVAKQDVIPAEMKMRSFLSVDIRPSAPGVALPVDDEVGYSDFCLPHLPTSDLVDPHAVEVQAEMEQMTLLDEATASNAPPTTSMMALTPGQLVGCTFSTAGYRSEKDFKKSYYKLEDIMVPLAVKEAEEHYAKNLDLAHYTRLLEAFKQRKASYAKPAKNVKVKKKH